MLKLTLFMSYKPYTPFLKLFLFLLFFNTLCITTANSNNLTKFVPKGMPNNIPVFGVEIKTENQIVRYYIINNEISKNAMIIFTPGSGCDGAFRITEDGKTAGSLELFSLKYINQAQILVLEAPGIPRQYSSPEFGISEGCPDSYIKQANFNAIINSYLLSINTAINNSKTQIDKILIVGASDGVEVATALAKEIPKTSMISLVSGFGISQMFDVINYTMANNGQNKKEISLTTVNEINKIKDIFKNPNSTNLFYGGHPYSRWASTGVISSAELVLNLSKNLRVYITHGGQDTSTPASRFMAGISLLISKSRPFAFQFIPCGNHQLICEEDNGKTDNLEKVIDKSIRWFLADKFDMADNEVIFYNCEDC